MLKLVLLFSFVLFTKLGLCRDEKVIFQDQAVFKIEEDIYFKTDIEKLRSDLILIHCLIPDSVILKTSSLKIPEDLNYMKTKGNIVSKNDERSKSIVSGIITLQKILSFTKQYSEYQLKDLNSLISKKKCSNLTKKKILEKIRSYGFAEIFLRQRFLVGNKRSMLDFKALVNRKLKHQIYYD